ncbi:MAG: flagellar protein FlaG [Planctomycetota bacterium]
MPGVRDVLRGAVNIPSAAPDPRGSAASSPSIPRPAVSDVLESSGYQPPAPQELDKRVMEAVTNHLNQVMTQFDRSIRFDTYGSTGQLYVKIVNGSTDEVIKTIPPENLLALSQRIDEAVGLLLDEVL